MGKKTFKELEHSMQYDVKASPSHSIIRSISLLRRLGSIFVVLIIFLLLISDSYYRIRERLIISDLKEIKTSGISQFAQVEKEYKIVTINYKPQLTFKYSFLENGETYRSEYTLFQFLPQDTDALNKLFTVHYLKEDPEKNSLNIEDEIKRIETKINESSTFWFIFKILAAFVFGFILLGQIISLISEIKNINKPIQIPGYLSK
jgi:hypothetical protein